MTLRTATETYATEGEARAYADAYRRNYRGYDGEAYVYRCNLTGKWVVNASRYLTCD
jgi:hypothetical protein